MSKQRTFPALRHILVAILLSFPIVLMILPAGRRASFYMLLVCALVCVVCRIKPGGRTFLSVLKTYWQINLTMAAMLIAVLLHQLGHGEFAFKPIEKTLQLAIFPLMLWTLLFLSGRDLRLFQWALISGGTLSSAVLIWTTQGGSIRLGVISNPLVPFSNLTLLMGFMALLSIGWNDRTEKAIIALKTLTACACLYASYCSGTRGGWIATPFFIIIAVALKNRIHNWHKVLISFVAMIGIASAMAFLPYTKSRLELAYSEIKNYTTQDSVETSVGIRFQLWEASWDVFLHNPVFGSGTAQYAQQVKTLGAKDTITLHAHNDVLYALATLGIFGVIAIFALYLIPCFWFIKIARGPDKEQRVTAEIGLAVCAGFFVFGLTDTMFYWTFCNDFYTITLATLFALLIQRQEELKKIQVDAARFV
jgi:O-antigen ligase